MSFPPAPTAQSPPAARFYSNEFSRGDLPYGAADATPSFPSHATDFGLPSHVGPTTTWEELTAELARLRVTSSPCPPSIAVHQPSPSHQGAAESGLTAAAASAAPAAATPTPVTAAPATPATNEEDVCSALENVVLEASLEAYERQKAAAKTWKNFMFKAVNAPSLRTPEDLKNAVMDDLAWANVQSMLVDEAAQKASKAWEAYAAHIDATAGSSRSRANANALSEEQVAKPIGAHAHDGPDGGEDGAQRSHNLRPRHRTLDQGVLPPATPEELLQQSSATEYCPDKDEDEDEDEQLAVSDSSDFPARGRGRGTDRRRGCNGQSAAERATARSSPITLSMRKAHEWQGTHNIRMTIVQKVTGDALNISFCPTAGQTSDELLNDLETQRGKLRDLLAPRVAEMAATDYAGQCFVVAECCDEVGISVEPTHNNAEQLAREQDLEIRVEFPARKHDPRALDRDRAL